jgi:hypothetical protein
MTAVTVVDRLEVAPAFEIVEATATDGYTFASKLSEVVGAFAMSGATHAITAVTVSGRTLTIVGTSLSAETVYIMVVGRL